MSEKRSTFNPIGKSERIHVLDALRGFAIFGILMINILVFSGYTYMTEDVHNGLLLADWNTAFDRIHTVFFRGKFYTLFSLLFGIGFAIQFIRASSTDRSFLRHFSRRLFFLLLIGIVHLWGIWFGDILVLYALCGYVLILFKDLPDRKLLFWAALIILLFPGLYSWYLQMTDGGYTVHLYHWLSESWIETGLPKASAGHETFQVHDLAEVVQSHSWSTVLSFNYLGPVLRGYVVSLDGRFFKVLGMFVLGLWVGRQLLMHKLHENRPFLIRIAVVGFLVGVPMNIVLAMDHPGLDNMWLLLAMDALTALRYVILTAAYAAAFMLLFRTRLRNLLNGLFNAVGKTALSNYILQSLIGILVFYNVGLGLGQYLGSAALTLAVFVIFAFQAVISVLWLKRYKYGPLEWVWRVLTYGRYIKNRLPHH
ncbi:MAG: DUF418 domain-containing protein [Balneolaceae bacterium]